MTNKFSIKDLERLSGIKAHTIRIWEQRYNLLNPERTDTNIRYYSGEDLKLILNVSLLNNNGIKISKIVGLSYQEISEEVKNIMFSRLDSSDQINNLMIAMIEFDETRFEEIINTNISQSGFEHTAIHIIYPFLDKVGMMWQTGAVNPAQEHFISNLIRQKFIVAIDSQKNNEVQAYKKYILFLPEGELHELGLLFCTYVIKKNGHKVFYLGQSISLEDLKKVNETIQADYILTMVTSQFRELSVLQFAEKLSAEFSDTTVILYGYQVVASGLVSFKNIVVPDSTSGMIDFISEK